MPILPVDFTLSQASLQDYVDCPRRFQLRYLMGLAWPAMDAEPADEFESQVALGQAFHKMVHQHILGLEPVVPDLSAALLAPDARERLEGWWEAYLSHPLGDLPALRFPEVTLSATLRDVSGLPPDEPAHRLVAKYDLIALQPGERAVIVDWKTSERRYGQAWLAGRLQTRVYRYLLVRAGAHLNANRPIRPEQVEMIYWFASHPEDPVRLPYDATQYRADAAYLANLEAEIRHRDENDFPLTTEVKRCLYCTYRSLCDRGAEAGDLDAADIAAEDSAGERAETAFDFEQIAEIAF